MFNKHSANLPRKTFIPKPNLALTATGDLRKAIDASLKVNNTNANSRVTARRSETTEDEELMMALALSRSLAEQEEEERIRKEEERRVEEVEEARKRREEALAARARMSPTGVAMVPAQEITVFSMSDVPEATPVAFSADEENEIDNIPSAEIMIANQVVPSVHAVERVEVETPPPSPIEAKKSPVSTIRNMFSKKNKNTKLW